MALAENGKKRGAKNKKRKRWKKIQNYTKGRQEETEKKVKRRRKKKTDIKWLWWKMSNGGGLSEENKRPFC